VCLLTIAFAETEVICFVINECSAFFIGLKEKLDGMGLFDGGLKVKKPGKTSAFNLWVKEVSVM